MKICGLQKTTLLDFPGHVAAVLFTGGCNFRCPFCHNSSLLGSYCPDEISQDQVLDFLNKRKHILDGLCISGGEPALQSDLEDFILQARSLGYLIKLDTNGSCPDILKSLCEKDLLDYVAMDIKAGPENYPKAAGRADLYLEPVNESISFLLKGTVPFEFRTTAVKGIHTSKDFEQIGPWIQGAEAYYIQNYKDSQEVLQPDTYAPFTPRELQEFADLVRPYVGKAELRGVD